MNTRRAVTLIELLVAILASVIVGYVAFDMVNAQKTNYVRTKEKVKLQTNVRDAMRIMELEMRNIGFATSVANGAGLNDVATNCPLPGGVTTNIDVTDNPTMAIGDVIQFRYFETLRGPTGSPLLTANCATSYRQIAYRLNNGTLERMRSDPNSAVQNWVPFLNDVLSFQVEYGMRGNAGTIGSEPFGTTAFLENQQNWTPQTAPNPTASLLFNGWSTALQTLKTNVDVPVFRGSVYQVVLNLAGNPTFLDPINGYNRVFLQVGMMASGGNAFLAGASSIVWAGDPITPNYTVNVFFTPTVDLPDARFGIQGNLLTPVNAATANLTITNLSIQVVSQGTYQWNTAPTNAQLPFVSALRVTILAKTQSNDKEGVRASFTATELGGTSTGYTVLSPDAQKTHILLQRVIPVVNN